MDSPPLIPAMFMSPDGEFWASVCCAWQSDFLGANAQERSHGAASEDTASNSATIEPANSRLIIMPISILRQSVSPLQLQQISGIYFYSTT
jgi:hypothetical protein